MRHKKPDVGATYPIQTPAESDEFNTDVLGLQWQWHANPRVVWSALLRGKDYLRLFAVNQPQGAANLWPVPNLLLQKFPAPDFTATTKVTWQVEFEAWQEKKAGLIITGNDYAYLAISQDDKGYKISQVRCKNAEKGTAEEVVAEKRIGTNTAYLRVNVSGPDAKCRFSYSEDGQRFTPIGEEFTALPDKWIGAKVGLFATSASNARRGSYADFDWFRVTK